MVRDPSLGAEPLAKESLDLGLRMRHFRVHE